MAWDTGKSTGRRLGRREELWIKDIGNSGEDNRDARSVKEDVTMNLNTSLISNNNSYANQVPKYIVIHNTDNFAKGANAKAHAKAQHDGNFSGYSAHVYVDDTEAYQARLNWLMIS